MEAQKTQHPLLSTPITISKLPLNEKAIHKPGLKRLRWRPSELEIVFLKAYLEKNPNQSKEERRLIMKALKENFNTYVHPTQLDQWLKTECRRVSISDCKTEAKSTYRKFSPEQLHLLQESFDKDNYPNLQEMTAMAQLFKVSLSKIENWYKHTRRTLAKQGRFELKTKKKFKKDELTYLTQVYANDSRPNKIEINKIAEHLECDFFHIKNWFSNKRKKSRLLVQKPLPKSETTQDTQESDTKIDTPGSQTILHFFPQFNSSQITCLNPSELSKPMMHSHAISAQSDLNTFSNLDNFAPIFAHYPINLIYQKNSFNSIAYENKPFPTSSYIDGSPTTGPQGTFILSAPISINPNLSYNSSASPLLKAYPSWQKQDLKGNQPPSCFPKQFLHQPYQPSLHPKTSIDKFTHPNAVTNIPGSSMASFLVPNSTSNFSVTQGQVLSSPINYSNLKPQSPVTILAYQMFYPK